MDRLHDPGSTAATDRAVPLEDAAAEPIEVGGGHIRVGTASWTDPTMVAQGVFYPTDANTADERGQLGSILLQYPRWVFPSNENRAAIEDAVERLDGWKAAVEFRNGSWLNEKNAERTLGFLRDRDIAFVMVDEPQGFKSSVPPTVAITSDLALVRFHGRNAATWEAKGITPAERFRYLYPREELSEWVPPIRHAASEAKDTHVLMNNCYANYGTTNARELAALLSGELSD